MRIGAWCVLFVLVTEGRALAGQSQSQAPATARVEIVAIGGATGGLDIIAAEMSAAFAEGLRLGGLRNVQTDTGSSFKWVTGGGVAIPLAPRLFVTGGFLLQRVSNPRFTGTTLGQSVSVGMRTAITEYVVGVEYRVLSGPTTPYIGGGVGLARLAADFDSADLPAELSVSQTDGTWNIGGGVRLRTGNHWAIRPDVRLVGVPGDTLVRASVGLAYEIH